MKTLLAILTFAAVMTALTPQVFAQSISIPAIKVEGLGNFRGKFITAFYAVGSPASIATRRDQMNLRVIKDKKVAEITGDSVTFSSIPSLTWNGLMMPYNLIVFAIHTEKEIAWSNANGTMPEGSITGALVLPLYVDSLTRAQVNAKLSDTNVNLITHTFNAGY